MLSLGGQAPHVLRVHTGHTRGGPNEIEFRSCPPLTCYFIAPLQAGRAIQTVYPEAYQHEISPLDFNMRPGPSKWPRPDTPGSRTRGSIKRGRGWRSGSLDFARPPPTRLLGVVSPPRLHVQLYDALPMGRTCRRVGEIALATSR